MSARRDRVARVTRVAEETKERARARWIEANQRVLIADRRRESALQRAGKLADQDVPIGLRSHLIGAGARHLIALADEKAGLVSQADDRRSELNDAVTKVRSLERLVERIDRAEAERRQRVEAAELQDLVAIKAARGSS